jgi:hypothetical protein
MYLETVPRVWEADVEPLRKPRCTCGHSHMLHGDRAVTICGGYELVDSGKNRKDIPIRCTCKGFQDAES